MIASDAVQPILKDQITHFCFGSIQHLALSAETNRSRFVEAGVFGAISNCMSHYEQNLDLLRIIFMVTMNLTYTKPACEEISKIMEWKVFVGIVERFVGDEKLQESSCGTISNLCHHVPENRAILGDAGACAAVMVSMANHIKVSSARSLSVPLC